MSRTCSICKRGTTVKTSRSHSHIGTLRKVGINIQKRKVNGKSAKVCTKCIKTINK